MKEMGPWNGRGAEGGAAEKPVRVKRASAAGREGTRRSHSLANVFRGLSALKCT